MKQKTIKEIQALFKEIQSMDDPLIEDLKDDSRSGVQRLIKQKIKAIQLEENRFEAYLKRLDFEKNILDQDPQALIAGVDEVGRGPLAGPVMAAAVILPADTSLWIEVEDSKQLKGEKRAELADLIKKEALAYAITAVEPILIDRYNIYEASRMAMLEAVEKLETQPSHLLIDAMKINSPLPQQSIVKGDQRSLSIAAASIIAKEERDQLMRDYAKVYPEFGFEKHMGYPTKQHLDALKEYGKTPLHRESFTPVAQTLKIYSQKI